MKKNKYLASLTILLSCMGLMNSVNATNQTESEYAVELRGPAGVIQHDRVTISSQLLEEGNRDQLFQALNTAFNSGNIGNDRTYYNFRGALSRPEGIQIHDGQLSVLALKQKADFHIQDNKLYLVWDGFRGRVYTYVPPSPLPYTFLEGEYLSLTDYTNLKRGMMPLYLDGGYTNFSVTMRNESDLDELRDTLNFFQRLADQRGEDLNRTLDCLCDGHMIRHSSLVQESANEYVFTASNRVGPIFQFHIKDESGQSDWYRSEWAQEFDYVEFFPPQNTILTRVESFGKNYSPNINVGKGRFFRAADAVHTFVSNMFFNHGNYLSSMRYGIEHTQIELMGGIIDF